MTREELQRLSKAELMEIVLQQQVEMEKLQAILAKTEGRLTRAVGPPNPGEEVAEPAAIQQREREQATRDALRHLDDAAYLAQSALAKLILGARSGQPEGQDVQQALRRAIVAMRPASGQSPHPSQQQRHHKILRLTYVEKKGPAEVARAVSISERQYYRDLKAAIQRVVGQVRIAGRYK